MYFQEAFFRILERNSALYYKHIGIYGYTREFVLEYAAMAPTALETSESLEQLRVLENGYKLKYWKLHIKV